MELMLPQYTENVWSCKNNEGKLWDMQVLVIGVEGYIGSRIYQEMQSKKIDVIGTSRKGGGKILQFELGIDEADSIINALEDANKTAIICAGISNIDKCKNEYEIAYYVNVKATKNLIDKLYIAGFQIIYFSSDNVFDGKKGNYSEHDVVNPINAYGCMKVEVEKYLQENIPRACIFRLTKVVDSKQDEKNMFYNWEKHCHQTTYCFKNNLMTCVAMDDVVNACILAIQFELTGIYHLASDKVMKRKMLMELFFSSMQIKNYYIEERDIEDFDLLEKRPLDTSLNNGKFRGVTNYCFLSMKGLIEKYVTNRNVSVNRK